MAITTAPAPPTITFTHSLTIRHDHVSGAKEKQLVIITRLHSPFLRYGHSTDDQRRKHDVNDSTSLLTPCWMTLPGGTTTALTEVST